MSRLLIKESHKQFWSKGFTLMELMVVIAIIAIMATTVAFIGSKATSRARDNRRIADLRSIQGALEMFYAGSTTAGAVTSANRHYPKNIYANPLAVPPTSSPSTGIDGIKPYMSVVPVDPTNKDIYVYTYAATPSICDNLSAATMCTRYTLVAKLENANNEALNDCSTGSSRVYTLCP